MKNKIIIIVKYTILLGLIAVALNILFGENTIIFVEKELIPNTAMSWYKYDINAYIQNLNSNVTNTTKLTLQLPNSWFNNVINAIISIINYIIFGLNILLYPLKIGGYVMSFVLALIGLNTSSESGLYWLGVLSNRLLELQIPQIPLT